MGFVKIKDGEKEARTPREDREAAPKLLQGPGGQLSVPMPGPLWTRLRLTQFGSSMGGAREMEYHRTNRRGDVQKHRERSYQFPEPLWRRQPRGHNCTQQLVGPDGT